jgi:AcrR family transcriptional regulator
MRRLAGELGVGTMTLYGYVRDKRELLDLAADRGAERFEFVTGEGPWRPRLRRLMWTVFRSLNEHPSAVQIRSSRPLISAGVMRACEAGMRILFDAGFDATAATRAWRLLFVFTFGYAAFGAPDGPPEVKQTWKEELSRLPPDEFPTILSALPEAVDTMSGTEPFGHCLELILDGLEAQQRSASPSA